MVRIVCDIKLIDVLSLIKKTAFPQNCSGLIHENICIT